MMLSDRVKCDYLFNPLSYLLVKQTCEGELCVKGRIWIASGDEVNLFEKYCGGILL